MNKLLELNNMGFDISWKLIDIGLHGFKEIPALLDLNEILEYFDESLSFDNDRIDDVIMLICYKDDFVKFESLLSRLSDDDKSNINIQVRKWKTFLLNDLLNNISQDYFQGLLALMEFWISMGISEDCPHAFPNSSEENETYFSHNNYLFLLEKNYVWLKQEKLNIIMVESEGKTEDVFVP